MADYWAQLRRDTLCDMIVGKGVKVVKTHIALWAGFGFLAASAWAFLAYATSPESFLAAMREPVVRAALYLSCPIAYFRQYPMKLWTVLLVNAATFALVGWMVESLIARKRHAATSLSG